MQNKGMGLRPFIKIISEGNTTFFAFCILHFAFGRQSVKQQFVLHGSRGKAVPLGKRHGLEYGHITS